MSSVQEIETALRQLPREDQWEVARWLLDNLEEASNGSPAEGEPRPPSLLKTAVLPDYPARRRRTFGDKILPNMVLTAREQERW